MLTLTLEHRVRCAPPRLTPRVMEVAAMFGLGADRDREMTIVPRTALPLPVPGPGIVLITGPSGSGKSTLLHLIAAALRERGCSVRSTEQVARHTCSIVDAPSPGGSAVIDLIAPDQSLQHAMEMLSLAGLSDAFIMLRRPGELSDGQRFRFRLAAALAGALTGMPAAKPPPPPSSPSADPALQDFSQNPAEVVWSALPPAVTTPDQPEMDLRQSALPPSAVICIDEFAATLDRITAITLARNLRRWSDRSGVTFILATTHEDLLDALQPDVLIHKGLGEAIDIVVRDARPQSGDASDARLLPNVLVTGAASSVRCEPANLPPLPASIAKSGSQLHPDDLHIAPGTLEDYRALAHFHYRSHHVGGATSVLRIMHRQRADLASFAPRREQSEVIGVLVRSLPALSCAARDIATAGRYASLDPRERGIVLNREVRCISRVVIDPRFRGLGLAVKLVRYALAHPENDCVGFTEALAAMGRVNPFFQRAGMHVFDLPAHTRPAHARLLDVLEHLGLAPHDLATGRGGFVQFSLKNRIIRSTADRLLLRESRRFLQATRRLSHAELDAMSEPELFRLAQQRLMLQPVYFFFAHRQGDADSPFAGPYQPC